MRIKVKAAFANELKNETITQEKNESESESER